MTLSPPPESLAAESPPLDWALQRLLSAMIWLESARIPKPWHRILVAAAADLKSSSGSFKSATSRLRDLGYISYPRRGHLALEHDGRVAAGEITNGGTDDRDPPTLAKLHENVIMRLALVEALVMGVLLDAFPKQFEREALQDALQMPQAPEGPMTLKTRSHLAFIRSKVMPGLLSSARSQRELTTNAIARLSAGGLLMIDRDGLISATEALFPRPLA